MPFSALAAGIAATGTLVGAAVKNHLDKKRYNQQLKDQQKMWQQANYYNSPAAQRMRLQQAGLNPNLVYQNGAATPTSDTVTPPSYSDSPILDFNSSAQFMQQSDLVKAQVDKMTAETQGLNYENIFKLAHSEHVDEETKQWLTNLALNNIESQTRIKSLEASTGLTQAEAQNAMLNWFKISSEIKEITSRAHVNEKTVEHLDALIAKTNAETDLVIKQYEIAIINKSLLSMQEMAESKADKNSFELAIENLAQTVESLRFANSEVSRRKQLVPSMNVPEQQKIYNDAFGDDFVTGTAKTVIDELSSSIRYWNEQRIEAKTERERKRAEKERQKAIDEMNRYFERQARRIQRQQRVNKGRHF